MEQKQILIQIKYYASYPPFECNHMHIHDLNEDSINSRSEAMDFLLDGGIKAVMDELDTGFVIDFDVISIGYNLTIPKPKPKRTRKAKLSKNNHIQEAAVPEFEPLNFLEIAQKAKPSSENVYGSKIINPLSEKISDDIKKALGGKKFLMLENSSCFDDSVGNFYRWSLAHGLDSHAIFNVRNKPLEFIASKILEYDVLVYQSQYVYESTKQLIKFVTELKEPKTIIECYIHQANWYYKFPEIVHHNVFILDANSEDVQDWEIEEILER